MVPFIISASVILRRSAWRQQVNGVIDRDMFVFTSLYAAHEVVKSPMYATSIKE